MLDVQWADAPQRAFIVLVEAPPTVNDIDAHERGADAGADAALVPLPQPAALPHGVPLVNIRAGFRARFHSRNEPLAAHLNNLCVNPASPPVNNLPLGRRAGLRPRTRLGVHPSH